MKVTVPNWQVARLSISIQDHSNHCEEGGTIVYLEREQSHRDDGGRWVLYVWPDVNKEDPVKVYLDGALEARRGGEE